MKKTLFLILFIIIISVPGCSALSGSITISQEGNMITVHPTITNATRYKFILEHPLGTYNGSTPWITISTPNDIQDHYYVLHNKGFYRIILKVYNATTDETSECSRKIEIIDPVNKIHDTIIPLQTISEDDSTPGGHIGNFWEATGIMDLYQRHPIQCIIIGFLIICLVIVMVTKLPPRRRYYYVSSRE